MTTAIAIPGNTASTFLTHFFGGDLADDTYVVERLHALVNGDIRLCPDQAPAAKKVRRKGKYATATLKAVQAMRPVCGTTFLSCNGLANP